MIKIHQAINAGVSIVVCKAQADRQLSLDIILHFHVSPLCVSDKIKSSFLKGNPCPNFHFHKFKTSTQKQKHALCRGTSAQIFNSIFKERQLWKTFPKGAMSRGTYAQIFNFNQIKCFLHFVAKILSNSHKKFQSKSNVTASTWSCHSPLSLSSMSPKKSRNLALKTSNTPSFQLGKIRIKSLTHSIAFWNLI